jgi:hypothetical protein
MSNHTGRNHEQESDISLNLIKTVTSEKRETVLLVQGLMVEHMVEDMEVQV